MRGRSLLLGVALACLLFVCSVEAAHDTQDLSADLQRTPPGADDEASLGEADDSEESPEDTQDQALREKQDEEEVRLEAKTGRTQELGESNGPAAGPATAPTEAGGEQQAQAQDSDQEHNEGTAEESSEGGGEEQTADMGKFNTNVFVTQGKSTLRVGEAWGMPGLYSSDGGARDLILGTAGGKKIYFGTAKNDAWIESTTGHM